MPVSLRDASMIVGIGLLLLVLLMGWAKYLRPTRRERTHRHSSFRSPRVEEADEGTGSEDGEKKHHHHHRRRRHRRAHRSLNPTLAETGGLPPPRSEGETPRAT